MPSRPTNRPARRPAPNAATGPRRSRRPTLSPEARERRLKIAAVVVGIPAAIGLVVASYFWVSYGRMIDQRLGAGEEQPIPRIFGRPVDLYRGEGLSPPQLEARLNEVGYAQRPKAALPGEFSISGTTILLVTRPAPDRPSQSLRVDFQRGSSPIIAKLTDAAGAAVRRVTLEAPLLTALAPGEKRRYVPLSHIPRVMIDAVVDTEDRRFFEHPGVDPIGAARAMVTNLRGNRSYLVGGSTLTQQIVKNTFLTPAKTIRRKLQEQFMALVLESRFTKNQILELYLNDVTLGQRGPFEIHGVAEAARIFFGKDVSNLSLAEAATIAGLIQSPSRLSPFRHPDAAKDRRNVVLRLMADAGDVTAEAAARAAREPIAIASRALENEAPYFTDFVSQQVDDQYGNLLKKDAAVDVYTTLDLQLQRMAQEAVAEGIAHVDKALAGRKRKGHAEVALLAVDPRTGDILAFVGGRAYSQSQYDRVVVAKRQPGSAFKPFVYLAAFQRMAEEGRGDLTPATVIDDEPTTFKDGQGNDYTPANYKDEYGGPVTLRDALAHSRNIVAVKVAETTGYDRVVDLWKRIGVGAPIKPYPSLALGVFPETPFDMTTAYTLFVNDGAVRPLRAITRLVENGKSKDVPAPPTRRAARADATFLVVDMMRSVLDEGTAAGARAAGFTLDAAGKTGTTNDLRDAWFIGFTPELLTTVWVGFDDNQPLGLSGAQAALPIWTSFMKHALSAHHNESFSVPEGIVFADIDKANGKLATPACPDVIREAFLAGTVPTETCDGSAADRIFNVFSKFGGFFKRLVR